MLKVILIWRTDGKYSDKKLIGVATDMNEVLHICIRTAGNEGWTFGKSEIYDIMNSNQTSGYPGLGEFMIKEIKTNTILKP